MDKISETVDQTVEGIYEGLIHGASIAIGANKGTDILHARKEKLMEQCEQLAQIRPKKIDESTLSRLENDFSTAKSDIKNVTDKIAEHASKAIKSPF